MVSYNHMYLLSAPVIFFLPHKHWLFVDDFYLFASASVLTVPRHVAGSLPEGAHLGFCIQRGVVNILKGVQ